MKPSRLLGLDLGSRHIGVAIADVASGIALPREAWLIQDEQELIEKIREVVDQDAIDAIVVGLPVGMQGVATPQTKEIQEITEKISQNLTIPVIVYDERLTSKLAESLTKGLKAGSKQHSIAAQKLLEDFLQKQRVQEETQKGIDQSTI